MMRAILGVVWLIMFVASLEAADGNPNLITATGYIKFYTSQQLTHAISLRARSDVMCALVCDGSAKCIAYVYRSRSAMCYLIEDIDEQRLSSDIDGLTSVWVMKAKYLGCWVDVGSDRAMPYVTFMETILTPLRCIVECKSQGFEYAGLQYSYQCYCGDNYWLHGELDDSACFYSCDGDPNIICGAAYRNSVYKA